MLELKIIRNSVKSSNIASIGYTAHEDYVPVHADASRTGYRAGTLEIEFKNGGIYRYLHVPVEVWIALRASESIGAYLSAHVKGKFETLKFEYEKAESEQ